MVKGKAVNNFTLMFFLQMWNIEEKRKENYGRYMYTGEERHDASMRNGGYVVPYGDSPFDGENVGENVYLDILNTANEYVHIMTPYLILDQEAPQCHHLCRPAGSRREDNTATYP